MLENRIVHHGTPPHDFYTFAVRNNQKNFIESYVWLFGGTKKAAKDIYKKADKDYILLVIESYVKQNRLAFWED